MESITTVSERNRSTPRIAGATKEELAEIAYVAIEGIEFREMNDGNRLGYHLYLYLNGEIPSVSEAIYEAKTRTVLPPATLEQILRERLIAAGVTTE